MVASTIECTRLAVNKSMKDIYLTCCEINETSHQCRPSAVEGSIPHSFFNPSSTPLIFKSYGILTRNRLLCLGLEDAVQRFCPLLSGR